MTSVSGSKVEGRGQPLRSAEARRRSAYVTSSTWSWDEELCSKVTHQGQRQDVYQDQTGVFSVYTPQSSNLALYFKF